MRFVWAVVLPSVVWMAGGCASADAEGALVPHRVVLQMRAGAGGGHPKRIDMTGRTSIYVDRVSATPLSFQHQVAMADPVVAYFEGGPVPPGKVFVVREVSFLGSSVGDRTGDGEFWLSVGDEDVVHVRNQPLVTNGRWRGRVEIHPGQEDRVFLELANSSTGTATVTGELVAAGALARGRPQ